MEKRWTRPSSWGLLQSRNRRGAEQRNQTGKALHTREGGARTSLSVFSINRRLPFSLWTSQKKERQQQQKAERHGAPGSRASAPRGRKRGRGGRKGGFIGPDVDSRTLGAGRAPLVLRWGIVGGACVYGRTAREKGAGEGPAPRQAASFGSPHGEVRRHKSQDIRPPLKKIPHPPPAYPPCTTQKDSTGDAVGWSWMTPMEAPQKMVFFILGLLVPGCRGPRRRGPTCFCRRCSLSAGGNRPGSASPRR